MRFEGEGISVWYGTEDTPITLESVGNGSQLVIIVGVQPLDASNKVLLHFRVNLSEQPSVKAKWWRNDNARNIQYFQTSIGPLTARDTVEYLASCDCVGRVAPALDDFKQGFSSVTVPAVADMETAAGPSPVTSQTSLAITAMRDPASFPVGDETASNLGTESAVPGEGSEGGVPARAEVTRALAAVSIITRQLSEIGNRIALVMLDRLFEMAFKEYIVHCDDINLRGRSLAQIFGSREELIRVVNQKVDLGAENLSNIRGYHQMCHKLILETATADVTRSDVLSYGETIRSSLSLLFNPGQ
jgi:hypothetical protein